MTEQDWAKHWGRVVRFDITTTEEFRTRVKVYARAQGKTPHEVMNELIDQHIPKLPGVGS